MKNALIGDVSFNPVPGGQTWTLDPRWGGMNLLFFLILLIMGIIFLVRLSFLI